MAEGARDTASPVFCTSKLVFCYYTTLFKRRCTRLAALCMTNAAAEPVQNIQQWLCSSCRCAGCMNLRGALVYVADVAPLPGIPDSISKLDSSSKHSGTIGSSRNDQPHRFSFEGSSSQHGPAYVPGAETPIFLVQAAVNPAVGVSSGQQGPTGKHKRSPSNPSSSSSSSSSSGEDSTVVRPARSSTKASSRGRSRSGGIRAGNAAAYSNSTHAVSLYSSSAPSSIVQGSRLQAQQPSSSGGGSTRAVQVSRRHLQQSGICPEGCALGFCVPAGNDPTAGFKCQQCLNNLVVDKVGALCSVLPHAACALAAAAVAAKAEQQQKQRVAVPEPVT